MIVLYKILILIILFIIFIQDLKFRLVYWFLYALFGILGFLILKQNQSLNMVLISSFINLIIIATVLLILFIYTKIIMNKNLLSTIGMGDILFFIALCFCFANFSFIVLFVFSLLFSLTISIFVKTKSEEKSIPLAGYMALFFIFIYSINLFNFFPYLFTL